MHVGGDVVVISPDYWRLRSAVNLYFETLGASIVLAILIAWLVARWLTGQAIRPLLTVTAELRRFAGGDFTPRLVSTADREELGSLIDAYNGAAAKVAAAFDERQHVEEHIRRFVADAGHELRTPLTVIDGYLQILRKAKPDDATDRERALATLQAQTRADAHAGRAADAAGAAGAARSSRRRARSSTSPRSRPMRSRRDLGARRRRHAARRATRRRSSPTPPTCTKRSATSSTTRSSTARTARSP